MTFFLKILKPYNRVVGVVISLSILASLFDGVSIGLLVPLLSNLQGLEETGALPTAFQWVVELLSSYAAGQQILWAMIFVLIAIILKNLFMTFSTKYGYWLSSKLVSDFREKAVEILMNVCIDFHYKANTGELIEKTINNTAEIEYIYRVGTAFIANIFTLIVLFSLLFLLSWELTLFTMFLGVFLVIFVYSYTKSFRKIGETAARDEHALMDAIHQSFTGILLIKSHSKEQDQMGTISEKINVVRHINYLRNFKVFTLVPTTDVLASIVIAILFGAAMVTYEMNTQLMLTELLPFVYILLRIVPLVKAVHTQRGEILSRWSYLENVHDLLRTDNKPFLENGTKTFFGLAKNINFKSVNFTYPATEKAILQDVSFSIPMGKTTAFVGDSGAGKSTIVSLLLRLYDMDKGEILLDNTPLQQFQLASYHRKIGIVSQDTFLFNNTVKYNIAFGTEKMPADEVVVAAAKKAGAHDFISALQNGYDTMIGDRGVRLSGGQRQRLSIARAIIRDPEILILDEATSSLDSVTERRIHQAIRELSLGRTVIIIAHRLSTIQDADQIIVMKNGEVVETGKEKALLAHQGEYYKLARAYENVEG